MMGKRRDLENSASVTVRLTATLVEEIDNYWRIHGMASRSHFVELACFTYLHLKKCPSCGAESPFPALYCCACGKPFILNPDKEMLDQLSKILEVNPGKFREIVKGIRGDVWKTFDEEMEKERERNEIEIFQTNGAIKRNEEEKIEPSP